MMQMNLFSKLLTVLSILIFMGITGCGGTQPIKSTPLDLPESDVAQPSNNPPAQSGTSTAASPKTITAQDDTQVYRQEPKSKTGNPPYYDVLGQRYYVLDSAEGYSERGIASWYGTKFHGKRTSSGETYNMYALSAAHKTLPIPTYVRVTHLGNQRSLIVRVNDRGPFHKGRIIDLSYAAAKKLGIDQQGTAFVEVTTIHNAPSKPQPSMSSTLADGKIYLQVGAYSQQKYAEQMLNRISAQSLPAKVFIHTNADASVKYRVHIGPIGTVALADQIIEQLSEIGIDKHYLISY